MIDICLAKCYRKPEGQPRMENLETQNNDQQNKQAQDRKLKRWKTFSILYSCREQVYKQCILYVKRGVILTYVSISLSEGIGTYCFALHVLPTIHNRNKAIVHWDLLYDDFYMRGWWYSFNKRHIHSFAVQHL